MKRSLVLAGVALASLLGALGLSRLTAEARAPAPPAADPSPEVAVVRDAEAPAEASRGVDARTQYAFLDELLEAQSFDHTSRYRAMRARWVDHRFTWEMQRVEPLCRRPDGCFVAPFDRARIADDAQQGFMPRLTMSDDQHATMTEACAAHDPCVIRFEGELTELVVRPDRPARLGLTDVTFVSARGVGDGERWFR